MRGDSARTYARESDLQRVGGVTLRPFHLTYSAACGLKGLVEPVSWLAWSGGLGWCTLRV